jgi:hypothetical protein
MPVFNYTRPLIYEKEGFFTKYLGASREMAKSQKRLAVIIGIGSLVMEFKARLNNFYTTHGLVTDDPSGNNSHHIVLSDEQIEKWAKLKVDDQLNAFLEWADCPLSRARDYLKSVLPWYNDHPDVALLRCAFHESVLDEIVRKYIYIPIAENIGQTWSVWSTNEMPDGDLMLEEGIDFRIHEWYRLTGKECPE